MANAYNREYLLYIFAYEPRPNRKNVVCAHYAACVLFQIVRLHWKHLDLHTLQQLSHHLTFVFNSSFVSLCISYNI